MAKTASGAASKRTAVTEPKNTPAAAVEVTDATPANPVTTAEAPDQSAVEASGQTISGEISETAGPIGPGEQLDSTGLDSVAADMRLSVRATPKKGFHRAGRYWPHGGVEIGIDELTEEQWSALEAEPKIVITPVE